MEYAKDEIFNIRYNEEEDRLEVGNKKGILHSILGESKILKMIIGITLVLVACNIVCIYNFYTLFSQL